MIEYRASLTKKMKFEGGFTLDTGTVIYVQETDEGWLGMYYEPKGSGHAFGLTGDEFSIWRAGDIAANELVVLPDPPEPAEEIKSRQELERRRLESKIQRHREEADRLEALLLEAPLSGRSY